MPHQVKHCLPPRACVAPGPHRIVRSVASSPAVDRSSRSTSGSSQPPSCPPPPPPLPPAFGTSGAPYRAPFFVSEVLYQLRVLMGKKYGVGSPGSGSLHVHTTLNLRMQVALLSLSTPHGAIEGIRFLLIMDDTVWMLLVERVGEMLSWSLNRGVVCDYVVCNDGDGGDDDVDEDREGIAHDERDDDAHEDVGDDHTGVKEEVACLW